jgi:hypothetical protein
MMRTAGSGGCSVLPAIGKQLEGAEQASTQKLLPESSCAKGALGPGMQGPSNCRYFPSQEAGRAANARVLVFYSRY